MAMVKGKIRRKISIRRIKLFLRLAKIKMLLKNHYLVMKKKKHEITLKTIDGDEHKHDHIHKNGC
jgi:hypothetical protein